MATTVTNAAIGTDPIHIVGTFARVDGGALRALDAIGAGAVHAVVAATTTVAAVEPTPAVSGAAEAGRVAACGPPGSQSWLCSTVWRITNSQGAADAADSIHKPVKVIVILVIAFVIVRIARRVIRRVVNRLKNADTGDRIDRLRRRTGLTLLDTSPVPSLRRALRAETIGAVLRSIVSVLVWATALLMALDELGVDLAALGVGAGILGVAIGFGSQSLVRDFLSGLFMLVEDQYGVGDVIDAGEASGTVEGVSLRTTRLRDVEGVVWHIPNGEIRRVGNKSQQWSRALIDVAVAYGTDLTHATTVIQRVADELAADPAFAPVILAPPEVWGVESLAPDRIVLRLVVKTRPLEQWRVARELRARLTEAFESEGIEIPVRFLPGSGDGGTVR